MPRTLVPLLLALFVAMLAACEPGIDDVDVLKASQAGLKVIGGRHCSQCGRIESKREVAASVYEYTLRMPDGTRSVFQETLPASWRVGERVGIIAGSDPALN
jgi:hypothetical protein